MKSLLLLCCFITMRVFSQNIGIGTTTPDAAAKLEIKSNNSGLLMPRLTSGQKFGIGSPPIGLMVYDSTLKLFSYYNGNKWSDIKPAEMIDSIWTSTIFNGDPSILNTIGIHTYLGGTPIESIGTAGNIDGVLTLQHGSPFPLTTSFWLSLDGNSMQARTRSGLINPPIDANLVLNKFGGNVGIGTGTPTHAKLEINGSVGAAVGMFGINAFGISIQANNPEVGFNYFFNGTSKTIKAGYGANIGMDPGSGDVYIGNFSGNQSGADFGNISGYQNVITVKQDGNVGIGITNPPFKLAVESNSTLYSGIRGKGSGYTVEEIPEIPPYTLYTHQAAIKAESSNGAVALEINGPVAVTAGNKDFVFDVYPQSADGSAMGFFNSLGSGYWAISLTGTGSPLNDVAFPNKGVIDIFVTPYIVWSNVPGTFNVPNKQILWYDMSTGAIRYLIDVEPAQVAKPIIRLKVMVIRRSAEIIF